MYKFEDLSVTDRLQERIDILEKRITSDADSSNQNHIVDSLLETNSLIFASLSGKPNIICLLFIILNISEIKEKSIRLWSS